MAGEKDQVVYSTGRPSGKRRPEPAGPQAVSLPPREQTARIQREKKGRGGKTVTVVSGLQLTPGDLEALAKRLKALCGSGGTVKEGRIEVQGDHRERIAAELQRLGYRSKFVGG
ncbi:MAG TPA: translation initiation factor [Anaerolineae bacterium]|nr:translation initiation factor [Anaerolineae bacterium]HOQ98280.1 translation initiation factor [Anaerolineae bacterium]HPL27615.1 translation initiation factor [Anaerolineae bacterium]